MSIYTDTLEILRKYNIRADKSLGQNFLISDEVVEKIIEKANINKDDTIIEIGPGLGVLTNLLLEKSNNVIAIELDSKMVLILNDRFKQRENLKIIHEDILKINLRELVNKTSGKVKVVANLPYYISTPIITKLLEANDIIDEIIVMVQKEVADKITAKSGSKNAREITYEVEYYAEAEEVIDVSRTSFVPSPKVDSAVIKLTLKNNKKLPNEEKLFRIIKAAFSQKRKTLQNALLNSNIIKSKEELHEAYKKLELETTVRGENLTLEQYIELSKIL